jgi:large subunit ribosomal protein L7/L12
MSEMKDVAVPEKFKALVAAVEKMSVLDLAELVKLLEDKFGVSAAAPAMMMAAAPAAAEAVEEKTSWNVELSESGANKIAVIKVLRELTGLGLKEAKDLVDAAPKIVKEGADKAAAEEMKKKIEDAGGKATLK